MMRWVRGLAAATGMVSLVFTMGCPGFFVYPGSVAGGGTGSGGNYVYVPNAGANSLAGFSIGTGTLSAVTNSPYALGYSPVAAVANPSNSILFVASIGLIYAYAIQSGGSLGTLNNGAAVGIANVVSMDISPDGQWLFVVDGNNLQIDEFQINSTTGALTAQTGSIYSLPGLTPIAHAIKVAPNGQEVFVALGTGGDLVFPLNTTTGALGTALTLAPASSTTSDNALAVNPASTLLFIARSGTLGGVAVFTIGSGGTLTQVTGTPFPAGSGPFSVAVNKTGTDIYVANQLDSTVSGYSVAGSGALTALSGSPYSSGSGVTALAADRTGDYLFAAAHGGSPDLTMYSFDQTTVGKLDLAASVTTGIDPTLPIAVAVTH